MFFIGCLGSVSGILLFNFNSNISALIAFSILCSLARIWGHKVLLFLAGIGMGWGFVSFWVSDALEYILPLEYEGKIIEVEGVVASIPITQNGKVRFELDVKQWVGLAEPLKHNLKKIMLSIYQNVEVYPSLTLRCSVKLKRLRNFGNKIYFDKQAWGMREKVSAVGYVTKKGCFRLNESGYVHWTHRIEKLRYAIKEYILNKGHLNVAPILLAITIGDTSQLSQQQWHMFQITGTIHLLIVSGLHLSIITGASYIIFRFVFACLFGSIAALHAYSSIRVALLFSAIVSVCYALLTGLGIATTRALVMSLVVIACRFTYQTISISRVLIFTLLTVLFIDPLAPQSKGFWFSFLAVIALMFSFIGYSSFREKSLDQQPWLEHISNWLYSQFAVFLVLMPWQMGWFSYMAPLSPLNNMLLIPVVSFVVVPLALLASLTFLFFQQDYYLFDIALYTLEYLTQTLEILLGWGVEVKGIKASMLIYSLATLLAFIALLPYQLSRKYYFMPFIICIPWLDTERSVDAGEVIVSVFDVGQGLSILVQFAHKILLYDTGVKYLSGGSAFESLVLPNKQWITKKEIDTLVVSHSDNDHAGGVDAVALEYPNLNIISDKYFKHIEHQEKCEHGKQWVWDGVRITLLKLQVESYESSTNNQSCMIFMKTNSKRILFTGDIEREVEDLLIEDEILKGPIDLFMVPHHGSITSSSISFLEKLKPKLAVVSAGYKNRYGHPHPIVEQRYRENGIELYSTGQHGLIQWRSASGMVKVYRQQQSQKWQY